MSEPDYTARLVSQTNELLEKITRRAESIRGRGAEGTRAAASAIAREAKQRVDAYKLSRGVASHLLGSIEGAKEMNEWVSIVMTHHELRGFDCALRVLEEHCCRRVEDLN